LDLQKEGVALISANGVVIPVSSSADVQMSGTSGTTYEFTLRLTTGTARPTLVELPVEMEYQTVRKRFWFKCDRDAPIHVEDSSTGRLARRSVADYLNRNQEMVLVGLDGGEHIYQGGDFYSIDYSQAEQSLLSQIISVAGPSCSTEKGDKSQIALAKKSKATSFASGSLFKRIAQGKDVIPFRPELLACDDLGSECADFVAANISSRRMALIHAKVGAGAAISASAFHEVTAQAMKNLAYMTRNAKEPQGAPSWRRDRYWNSTRIPRLLKGPAALRSSVWKTLRTEIIDRANADLHVVLVTAGCCDVATLREAVNDPDKRTAETAQLMHLIDGLNSFSRTLGVKLTIYDVPFS